MCIVFTIFSIYQNKLIEFERYSIDSEDKERQNNIEMALVQKGTPPESQKEIIENDEVIEANAVINFSPATQSLGVKFPSVELGYLDIIKVPRSLFGFGTAILCLNLWTYLDTTLALKLE